MTEPDASGRSAAPAESADRVEHDPLGKVVVPAGALYGAQTQRAVENFPISGLRPLRVFVRAIAQIKRAAALTHRTTGRLDALRADAIVRAADEVVAGSLDDHFVVDVFQAGAGTSLNMNVNEVIANRANELLGAARGAYAPVHPNDHVNMAQSTNDVIPTAIRLASLAELALLRVALDDFCAALAGKGVEFNHVVKAGRTHLQDAMPIRLGQEFTGWAATIARCGRRVDEAADYLRDLGIGGSAVGTGVNVEAEYPEQIVSHLRTATALDLRLGANRIELMQSMGDIVGVSGALRGLAIELSRIASDLRLLTSGPRTGFDELRLPAVQPGSSIMPGKVNPSIAEMVNQVCFQVIGNDTTVALSAEHGQLELNVMMPVMGHNVLMSIGILSRAVTVFTDRCVAGIEANEAQAAYWVERSAALATALAPHIGYARAAELAKESVKTGESIRALATRLGVLPPDQLDKVLDLGRMTDIGVPGRDP
ncbi:MAG: aspartate ammonia-lyase [Gemmatimonadetes bacterium]|nr:aspartate ammonia-lyase [Gemmatimonadota bacterium]